MTIAPMHCPRCGKSLSPAAMAPSTLAHVACKDAIALEPPRYCVMCGRRMKVQVVPAGWRAECVQHGVSTGGNAR